MFPGGFEGWLDAPVFAGFVSNADRIGTDDALTGIDAFTDWRWCSPTRKRGLGRTGIGPEGYDPLVRFNCLLIRQWYGPRDPKLERAPSTAVGFHAVLRRRPLCACARCDDPLPFSQPVMILRPGVAFRSGITRAEAVQSVAPAAILTHRKTRPKRRPPTIRPMIRTVHFSANTQARWVKKSRKRTPGDKIKSNGVDRPDEARTRKASSTRSTR